MKYLCIICAVFLFVPIGCRPSPGKNMTEAKKAEDSGNYNLAVQKYQEVVEDHPGTPEAETAMFMVATIHNNNTHEYEKAIEEYKAFATKYPASPRSATALFMVGYLYNNELNNLDSAKIAYERFLSKYPDHEMALSARYELENLGKSPDELLPRRQPRESASNTTTKRTRQN